MWIDKDECAFGKCKGGICQNLIAKDVSDKGFQCKCNAGYATIFNDEVCSRKPIDDMEYIKTSAHAQLANLDVPQTIVLTFDVRKSMLLNLQHRGAASTYRARQLVARLAHARHIKIMTAKYNLNSIRDQSAISVASQDTRG